jgi:hypothetical protein
MIGKKAVSSENLSIRSEDPNSPDAQTLLDELTAMRSIFGGVGDGTRPFNSLTFPGRSIFLLARDSGGALLACGALVPQSHYVANVIGPYCRFDRETVNGAVLARVEMAAAQFGFLALNSEVSEQNLRMLVFYQARGFIPTGSTSGHRSAGPGVCYLQKRLRQEANYFWSLLR